MACLAINDNSALGRWEVSSNQLHHGRFAGAIVAHQPDHFPRIDRKADVGQCPDGTKALRDALHIKQSHAVPPSDGGQLYPAASHRPFSAINIAYSVILQYLFRIGHCWDLHLPRET
jgi:hypothetical protein